MQVAAAVQNMADWDEGSGGLPCLPVMLPNMIPEFVAEALIDTGTPPRRLKNCDFTKSSFDSGMQEDTDMWNAKVKERNSLGEIKRTIPEKIDMSSTQNIEAVENNCQDKCVRFVLGKEGNKNHVNVESQISQNKQDNCTAIFKQNGTLEINAKSCGLHDSSDDGEDGASESESERSDDNCTQNNVNQKTHPKVVPDKFMQASDGKDYALCDDERTSTVGPNNYRDQSSPPSPKSDCGIDQHSILGQEGSMLQEIPDDDPRIQALNAFLTAHLMPGLHGSVEQTLNPWSMPFPNVDPAGLAAMAALSTMPVPVDSGTVTGAREHKCVMCNTTFANAANLRVHMRTHTGEKPFVCPVCSVGFTQAPHLKDHLRTHTGEKPFKCPDCNTAFGNASNLKRHMRTHTGERPFKCPSCDASFKCSGTLKNHLLTHSGEKKYRCDTCGTAFSRHSYLTVHIRTHTGEKPFECTMCHMRFSQSQHLQDHMRTHTGEKPHKCEMCNMCFGNAANLKRHMRTHTDERPFCCTTCNSNFKCSSTLKNHMLTHSGEKLFKCSVCEASFSRPSYLKIHMRTHTGERPFTCPVCQKGFSQSPHLQDHLRTHTGEKPFKCELCTSAFGNAANLKRHMKTHSDERPFPCVLCGSSFKCTGSLKNHMQLHMESLSQSPAQRRLTNFSTSIKKAGAGAKSDITDDHISQLMAFTPPSNLMFSSGAIQPPDLEIPDNADLDIINDTKTQSE